MNLILLSSAVQSGSKIHTHLTHVNTRTTLGVCDTCVLCHESGSQLSCGHASRPNSRITLTCQESQHAAVTLAHSGNWKPQERLRGARCLTGHSQWNTTNRGLPLSAEHTWNAGLTDALTEATKVKKKSSLLPSPRGMEILMVVSTAAF